MATAKKKPLKPKSKGSAKASRPSKSGTKAQKKTASVKTKARAKKKTAPGKPVRSEAKTPAKKRGAGKRTRPTPQKPAVRKPAAGKPAAGRKAGETAKTDRFQELKKMLLAKREGILREAKTEIARYVSGENRQLVDTALDEGDLAVVDISEDVSLSRLGSHRRLLHDIEECLRKMQEGTYGICEECGEEISEKRLSVIPTATLCVDCQEHKEKFAAIETEVEL
jgi:DnaK suppressor protein